MIIYLMVHLPFVWIWKIGFAHDSVTNRAKALDKEVFGFFLPVCFIVVPFAYRLEQWFHRTFKSLKIRFYKGSGSTETYLFIAAIPALAGMLLVWGIEFAIAGYIFKFNGLSFYWEFIKALADPKGTALFCWNDFKHLLNK